MKYFIFMVVFITYICYGITLSDKIRADTWYDNGLYLFNKGKYLKSMECFEKALSFNPVHKKAKEMMNKVIKIAIKTVKKKKAVKKHKYTKRYIINNSSVARNYLNLIMSKKHLINLKNLNTNFKLLNKYLHHNSTPTVAKVEKDVNITKAEELNKQALGYARDGKFKKAIELFKKACELDPYNPEIHTNLGLAYAYSDMLYQAIKEYKLVLKLADPKSKYYKIATNMIKKLKDFI